MRARATWLAVLSLLAAAGVRSQEPPSWTVHPQHGRADAPTELTLDGTGFPPGARVSLLGGGPFLAGAYSLPEGARSLEVHGDRACVAFYSHQRKLGGIQILDVGDPRHPVPLGSFETGDSGVGVQARDGLAYVAFLNPYTFLGGLHIVDLAHPGGPLRLGTFYTFVDPQAIVLDGPDAFVADGIDGLRIVDVSSSENPLEAGRYDSPGTAHDVVVVSGRAYLADGEGGLRVVDVGDPKAPVELGAYAPPGADILSVAVEGAIAYATDTHRGLQVFDVADPVHPSLLTELPLADTANGVALAGSLLYLAAGSSGLQIVDVSDPPHPRVVGGRGLLGNAGYYFDVAVSNGSAYVADIINGLQVFDVRFPASPAPAGGLDLPGVAVAIAVQGETGLLATGDSGLAVLDLGPDGVAPRLRSQLATPAGTHGVALASGRVIVAAGSAGLLVVDFEGPSGPAIVAARETPGEALGVATAGGEAFVADGSRGLQIFDVTAPDAPLFLGALDTAGTARGVAVAGHYAYVADDLRGLLVIDVALPAAPVLVSRLDTPGRAVGVVVSGDHAFVADLNRGVQVVDLSQPSAPRLVNTLGTPGAASGVALLGSRLLVACGFSGLLEFDITEPMAPVLTGAYDTPGVATGVTGALLPEGRVFVADGPRGIRTVRLNPALPAPSLNTGATLKQEIPAGFTPGPYDVQVTAPGGTVDSVLPDGFFVCGAGALSAHLEPSHLPSAVGPTPAPWRLLVDGDAALFDPVPRHQARLLLPSLPADLEIRQASGREAIEIVVQEGRATVLLSGADRDRMLGLWNQIVQQGGIALPRLDARTYGELRLAVHPGFGAGAPRRYRFEFDAGRLVDAGAWGAGARLEFEVTATDPLGCDSRALESL